MRAQLVASLIAAESALPANPDGAALLLDGALHQFVERWATPRRQRLPSAREALSLPDALQALDAEAPAVAWRLRLALQAHAPEARLVHCWSLLDMLTQPAETGARPTETQTLSDAAHGQRDQTARSV